MLPLCISIYMIQQIDHGRSVVVVDVEAQSKIHSKVINIVTWAYSPGNYLRDFSITGYQYKDFVL